MEEIKVDVSKAYEAVFRAIGQACREASVPREDATAIALRAIEILKGGTPAP